MARAATLRLVVALSAGRCRGAEAKVLARALGVEDLVLLVRDTQLRVLLPAPGFPQTLPGGPLWREFVARCVKPGTCEGEVDLPADTRRRALAIVHDRTAAVLIGGEPVQGEVEAFTELLPMLGSLLCAEQEAAFAAADAEEARRAASRAHALANALEAARAEGARLNAELREEHRRKDDFLAMLGHELRNPLTPLVTSVDLLRRGVLSDRRIAERQIEIMARQLSQLSRLVDDLLDVSRVSRGRVELRRQPLFVRDVLFDALEASRPLLDARRHRVDVSIDQDPLPIHADTVRLTQVFANLLHNAAKYTDPGGQISITATREGENALIRVSDNGIGIAPDVLPRIFDLFAQAPVSLGRAQGGLGIGLTLVRAMVQLHGGSVAAESPGLGAGSVFTVRLPLNAAAHSPAPPPAEERPAVQRKLRVMIVDDNQDGADTLAAFVRLTGHEVQVAYSGLKALQIAADFDPDLVFLDIGLPEVDGYEVLRRLRRVVRRSTRFVALTGYGSDEDRRRTRDAGFDEHIVKPVENLPAVLARASDNASRAAA